MTPKVVDLLTKLGAQVIVERGAGVQAGFPDADYEAKGVRVAASADEVREAAEFLLSVRVPGPAGLTAKHSIMGFCDPLSEPQAVAAIAGTGASLYAVELVPRITRAQAMDALSSMASIAGYKAVIIAAEAMPRMFPMMMTAAGTIPAAKVLIIGAGVAGLQAIATARRLGAVVLGYDVRAAVKEQI
jgi:NAD(P) transhydrogenase subunit alpha